MIALFLALAVVLTLHAGHPCRAALPRAPAVPAAIVLHTSCGWFELARDGRLTRLPNHWGAKHGVGTGRRYGAQLDIRNTRAGRIRLFLHDRLVWRSHGLHPADGGNVAFGPHEFAFSTYYRGVFLTDLRGPERLVARGRGLYPLDITRGGDVIVGGGRSLLLVSRAGRMLARYRFRIRNSFAFDESSDTLFFVTPGGRLAAVRNRRLRLGSSVRGLDGEISTTRAGLLVFTSRRRIVVTRPDGRFVATAAWSSARNSFDSWVSVSPDGRSFVYQLTSLSRGRMSGITTVYVLHPGQHHAQVLFARWRLPANCGDRCSAGAGFDWHGRFLLYTALDGHVALIDSWTRRVLDLTRFDHSLPHLGPHAEQALIAWKLDFPR